jgi:hypothetical protein
LKGGIKVKTELLDILAEERINGILEDALNKDAAYMSAKNEHQKVCNELRELELDKNQSRIVDQAISTANQCGARYGAVAYRQGLRDGIELVREVE